MSLNISEFSAQCKIDRGLMTVEISPLINPFRVKSATLIIFEINSLPSLVLKLLDLAKWYYEQGEKDINLQD